MEHRGRLVALSSAKALELFCYLAVHRDSAHSREKLAELLWPDDPQALARGYLRQAIWRLNAAFRAAEDETGGRRPVVVSTNSGWLRIDPAVGLWSDIGTFDRAYAAARDTPPSELGEVQVRDLREALALFRDGMPVNRFQAWFARERARAQETRLAILELLMEHAESRGAAGEGVAYGLAVLGQDQARETAHRGMMRLYLLSGDRPAALRQYHRCVQALSTEFGLGPSAETEALYRQISAPAGSAQAQAQAPALALAVRKTVPPAGLPRSRTEAESLLALQRRLEGVQEMLRELYQAIDAGSGPAPQREPG